MQIVKAKDMVAGALTDYVWDSSIAQTKARERKSRKGVKLEAVDRCLKDIRNSQEDYGGLTVVFGGDWAQTLPVLSNERLTPGTVIEKTLVSSPLWRKLVKFRLTENMRIQKGGIVYARDVERDLTGMEPFFRKL